MEMKEMKTMKKTHKLMKSKDNVTKRVRRLLTAAVLTAMALTYVGCAEDTLDVTTDPNRPFDPSEWGTCFASGALTESGAVGSPRKISTDYNMKYWWTFGDHIWVKDGDAFLRNDTSDIPKPVEGSSLVNDARFFFKAEMTDDEYEVRYTGNGGVNGLRADSVHITAVQWQTEPGAAHVGKYGDCAATTATRQADGSYTFQLNHKVSFLLFTPRVANASYNTKLRSITITKLNNSPGDSALCGSYYFDNDGLHTGTAMKNAGKKITLNLFKTDALGKEHYPFALSDFKDTDKCLYMVLQPGDHKLAITYEMVDSLGRKSDTQIQYVTHNKTTNKYEYKYTDSIAPATRWKVTRELKATAHTFTENGFTKVSHKLEEPTEIPLFRIPYTYYEWGASGWFWLTAEQNGTGPTYSFYPQNDSGHSSQLKTVTWTYSTGWPTNSDPADLANYERAGAPLSYIYPGWSYFLGHTLDNYDNMLCYPKVLWIGGTTSTNRWGYSDWRLSYPARVIIDVEPGYEPYWTSINNKVSSSGYRYGSNNGLTTIYNKTVGTQWNGFCFNGNWGQIHRSVFKMPSANEMTYYLKYGDIHRDNSTLWKIESYRGDTTLCRGGIWIKKRKVIEAEGHPFSTEKAAYQINGGDLDLRYQSPGNNYMFCHYNVDADLSAAEQAGGAVADVKYGVPANKDDYFFLPLLGYMHNVGNSPGTAGNNMNWSANKGQYKFVGAEGYYWTRTIWPNVIVSGQTNAYNTHGDREAYYLRITPYCVALCWDMRGNRIHGFVGNERPDWCRTMPYDERYVQNYVSESFNDTWFQ